jgi:hypothetical protein
MGDRNMTLRKVSLVIGMGMTIVAFQNCSKVNMQGIAIEDAAKLDVGSEVPVSNDDDETDVSAQPPKDESEAPLDATCKALISGSSAIAYDSIAEGGSAEQNFAISASNQDINYENVGSVSNGAAQLVSVKARSIGEVRSFAVSKVLLNAQKIGKVRDFAASQVVSVSHTVDEISNFAARLCVSAQEIGSLHDLASDMSIFGRSEGGQKAKLAELKQFAAFASLHDIDVEKVEAGSIRLRLQNGRIGSLSAGAGTIYLYDSTIEKIEKYAGTIHLYGSSKVAVPASSAVRIVQH